MPSVVWGLLKSMLLLPENSDYIFSGPLGSLRSFRNTFQDNVVFQPAVQGIADVAQHGPGIDSIKLCALVFSSPEHEVLMVSYCDQSLSAIVISLCPSSMRCQLFALNNFSSKTAR